MTNLFHHELLDRLYLITDMYQNYIVDHDSDDILSKKEKEDMCQLLWNQYQLVGGRISDKEDEEKKEKLVNHETPIINIDNVASLTANQINQLRDLIGTLKSGILPIKYWERFIREQYGTAVSVTKNKKDNLSCYIFNFNLEGKSIRMFVEDLNDINEERIS